MKELRLVISGITTKEIAHVDKQRKKQGLTRSMYLRNLLANDRKKDK